MSVFFFASRFLARRLGLGLAAGFALALAGCADHDHQMVISVPEQRMLLLKKGLPMAVYPVSTSKFGVGDGPGTKRTPLGRLEIARKIGGGAPTGTKFKGREQTNEIVAVDAPGRDPIVTRILWLRGLEAQNANAFDRYIYIHGTPEERFIGHPASFGCVRMRSRDVISLYDEVGTGAQVFILDQPLAVAAQGFLAKGAELPPGLRSVGAQPAADAGANGPPEPATPQ